MKTPMGPRWPWQEPGRVMRPEAPPYPGHATGPGPFSYPPPYPSLLDPLRDHPPMRVVEKTVTLSTDREIPASSSPRTRRLIEPDTCAVFIAHAQVPTHPQRVLVACHPRNACWTLEAIDTGKPRELHPWSRRALDMLRTESDHLVKAIECRRDIDVTYMQPVQSLSPGDQVRVTLRNIGDRACWLKPALLAVGVTYSQQPREAGFGLLEPAPFEIVDETLLPLTLVGEQTPRGEEIVLEDSSTMPFRFERLVIESDSHGDVEVVGLRVGNVEQFLGPGSVPVEVFAPHRSPRLQLVTAGAHIKFAVRLVNYGPEPRRVTVKLEGVAQESM